MKILIVEDEEALAKGLGFNFEQEGFLVELAGDGTTALELFAEAEPPFDLIILDLMLPGMSGYDVCREIRKIDPIVSVLVLSARTLSEDRATAFDAGADQYLSKPFALPELISRVRNLLDRRKAMVPATAEPRPITSSRVTFGDDITVDFDRFELHVRGSLQTLTTLELQLLRYFIARPDKVLSRNQIMQDVWGEPSAFSTRTVDNFVMRLRKIIEPDPANPQHFVSVRGAGYRFLASPDEEAVVASDSSEPETST